MRSRSPATRDADTALVTIGTIGDTAHELLDDDDDLLLVRVHAYRPFPAAELASVLSGASRVCVVDRAAAFGSFGPLGGDVRSLDLPARGGHERRLRARRHGRDAGDAALGARARRARPARAGVLAPVYVPEGV